ncbi:reverse transcriptase domain-containing protein [Tanacetum coccineum]
MPSTGIKCYIDPISGCKIWRTNRKFRIPIDLYPCKGEESMTMKKVGDQTIRVIRKRRIDKKDNVCLGSRIPHPRMKKEEEVIVHHLTNNICFVDHPPYSKGKTKGNKFTPYLTTQEGLYEMDVLGNDISWDMKSVVYRLIYIILCLSRNMVQTRQSDNPPDVAEIIAQQLQNIIPNIVTQVTNNLNNANGNGNGGGNNGCTYKGFVACGPRDFDRTGGAVALTRWIEKMESVIDNSGCLANQRVKYVASSFIGKALTWWNTQVQARGRDAANAMAWNDFKALLTTEFCPSNEIEKLEGEFWNHSMVGADHAGYTDRFHELAKLVPHLVTPEAKRVTSGTLAKAGKKRKERDEASKSESVGKDEKKAKGGRGFVAVIPPRRENGNLPKCARLNEKVNQSGNQLALEGNRNIQGNENQDRGRACNVNAVDALQDPNVVTGTYSLNNLYATVLFDSGAVFSFISTKFASLLNAKSIIANPGYVIEVANGRKEEVDRIFHGCRLELGDSMFLIDLIPFRNRKFMR